MAATALQGESAAAALMPVIPGHRWGWLNHMTGEANVVQGRHVLSLGSGVTIPCEFGRGSIRLQHLTRQTHLNSLASNENLTP